MLRCYGEGFTKWLCLSIQMCKWLNVQQFTTRTWWDTTISFLFKLVISCNLKKAQAKVIINFCLLGDDLIFTGKLRIHIVSAASVSIAPLPCLYSANSYSNCNEKCSWRKLKRAKNKMILVYEVRTLSIQNFGRWWENFFGANTKCVITYP